MASTERMTIAEYREAKNPRQRAANRQGELREQQSVFRVLRDPYVLQEHPQLAYVYSTLNGVWIKSPKQRWAMISTGLTAGVPDVVVPMARKGHHGLYIELKYGQNTLTAPQEAFRDHLLDEGYLAVECYTAGDVISTIEGYLEIKIGRAK